MFTLIQNLLSVLQLQVHRSPDSDCIIDSCGTVSQRLQQHLGQVVREAQALTRRRHLERYHCMFILKWAIPGLFFYIFLLFNPVESKHWSIYFFLMTGFEPQTCGPQPLPQSQHLMLSSSRRSRLVAAQLSNKLVFHLHEWLFINTTAYHLGWYELSTPVSCFAPRQIH